MQAMFFCIEFFAAFTFVIIITGYITIFLHLFSGPPCHFTHLNQLHPIILILKWLLVVLNLGSALRVPISFYRCRYISETVLVCFWDPKKAYFLLRFIEGSFQIEQWMEATQPAFTCSKLTIGTLEQGVKCVLS